MAQGCSTQKAVSPHANSTQNILDCRGNEIYGHDILQATGEFCDGRGNIIEIVRGDREAGFLEGPDGGILSKDSIEDGELVAIGNRFEGYKSIVRRTQ